MSSQIPSEVHRGWILCVRRTEANAKHVLLGLGVEVQIIRRTDDEGEEGGGEKVTATAHFGQCKDEACVVKAGFATCCKSTGALH